MTLDPYPRYRWIIQGAVMAVAAVAIGTSVMAAVVRIEPARQAPEPAPVEAAGERDTPVKASRIARGR